MALGTANSWAELRWTWMVGETKRTRLPARKCKPSRTGEHRRRHSVTGEHSGWNRPAGRRTDIQRSSAVLGLE